MHTCGEEISHVSTSPLTEHSVHDSAIPKTNHGFWGLASSELAMPQASSGGLAELARIKARIPSLPVPCSRNLRNPRSRAQGMRASSCTGEGVLYDHRLFFSCPGRAGLSCHRSCHQSPGVGWQWAFTLGQKLLPPGVLPYGGNCGKDTG